MLLFSISCFAQFSKTHYIPPLSNSDSQVPQGQYMYISCPSLTPVNFKIYQLGGTILLGTVSRDTPYVLNIGAGFDTQLLVSRNIVSAIRNDKGYIVEAEDLVYVTVRLTSTPQNYQAGGLVSKGLAALGTQFRIGAFINTGAPSTNNNHYTFASILATENNTTISFNDIKVGVSLINNSGAGNTPANVILNRGESYVMAVEGPNLANKDGLIGASITSDKPIAVNCGSFAGSNGTTTNLDLGFDQIVSAERTGKEYIFIKGNGPNATERPLLVANVDNTEIFLNGNPLPFITLNAGQYVALNGSQFSTFGNLYVRTSQNVFAYQGIGGTNDQANQNMHFVPPLSCETPKVINNIPFINAVGNNTSFTGTVCIVTEINANLNFIINGTSYSLATLPANITANGPLAVLGNTTFETYTFQGLTGNISVFSSKQVYLSYFGSSGAATYGGFYSGFTFKPEVTFGSLSTSQTSCIPSTILSINSLSSFNNFQWYRNGVEILGATNNTYNPISAGYYYVQGRILGCGLPFNSDEIPVSSCPSDRDNDLVNDNIDLDNDNDGILNCNESLGNQNIDLTDIANLDIVTTGTAASALVPYAGTVLGDFVTQTASGKNNAVSFKKSFTQPTNVALEYVATANSSDLLTSESEFIITTDIDKTITLLNPNNQLLVDTNYDGNYETGVTQFSSFEIRFRLNSTVPLAPGTGTFSFKSYRTTSLKFTHNNLLETAGTTATFRLMALCVPIDSDGDGITDDLDSDSDNDGIPDSTEAQGLSTIVLLNTDGNHDGIDDIFGSGINPVDSDSDGIRDYLDLDSDNDGIYDSIETGNNVIADADADGILNYLELDSDNDGCFDTFEAGYLDANNDGILGSTTPVVNSNGMVTNATGYLPLGNQNYIIAAPMQIFSQPQNRTVCEFQNTTFSVTTNPIDGFQWQVSTNGTLWTNLIDNALYTGTATATMQIISSTISMNGNKYRVVLNKNGNSCGLISNFGTLTILTVPVVNAVTIVQCDNDLDAITTFNLTIKNDEIYGSVAPVTFSYYSNFNGADTANPLYLILNPLNYENTIPGTTAVWARVLKTNGCYSLAKITLKVVVTNIPSTYKIPISPVCDDFLDLNGNNNSNNNDRDGVAFFNFSNATAIINGLLPSGNYTIKYYRNKVDALAEVNSITSISNYRNIGYPNSQDIWVRVESSVDDACYGLGPFITLTVEALPMANTVTIPRQCDDNQDGIFSFNTAALESSLLLGQTNVNVSYFDAANQPLRDANLNLIASPFPASFFSATQTIKAVVKNNSSQACADETFIVFTVDKSPLNFTIPLSLTMTCDDEADPLFQDGLVNFTTAQAIQDAVLLGQPAGMVVKYYDVNNILLTSPLPNPFPVVTSKYIRVVLENPLNPNCAISKIITFTVKPLPKIELEHHEIICTSLSTFSTTLTAGIQDGTPETDYTYLWSQGGTVIPAATASTLTVISEGIYTVTVSRNGCSSIRTITVVASDSAHFSPATIIDLSNSNSVTVNVSGNGNYVYSMDNSNLFQSSNIFTDVLGGIHEIFVKDLDGCKTVSQTISVIGIPAFFTPNNDGYNDTWNVKGVNAIFNFNSIIYIYDRNGKLLKQVGTTEEGWDGTFNGHAVPSDDYWFAVYLEDGRSAKGHFALKR